MSPNDVVTHKRRTSSRLSEIPEAKRPYYGPAPTPKNPNTFNNNNNKNKKNNNNKKKISTSSTETSTNVSSPSADTTLITNQQRSTGSTSSISTTGFPYVPHSAKDIENVKETLKIYNKHYLHFVQAKDAAAAKKCEAKKLKNGRADKKQVDRSDLKAKKLKNGRADKKQVDRPDLKAKKMKNGGADKKQVDRPDLKATHEMRNQEQLLYPGKRIGHLPGIDVGHQFCSRAEMVAVGLHSHWIGGIDYMGGKYVKKEDYKRYTFPLAVSIVLSGQYEDNNDNREEIEYTGQGGNDLLGSKHQYKNQDLKHGNLALKNSMDQSIPVRVTRGQPSANKGFKTYTYDGLYRVEDYRLDRGESGFDVYKFTLKRLEGQPKLESDKVEYKHGRSSNVPVKSPKLVSLDLSEGQEMLHIPVINTIDDATITGFTYTNSLQVPSNLKLPPSADGCNCEGNCTNPKTCACAKLNGGDFPYVQDHGGRLIEAKDVVFECGPNCGCEPGCINRISQRKIKYQLEVFRTTDRGWAVKTRDFIPSGAPVCEYIGKLQRTSEMDKVASNEYIFEIDCEHTIKGIGGRERRVGDASGSEVDTELEYVAADERDPDFCIDAGSIGNVARFINHSCDPNLFVQCVVSSHHELKLARIVLVAAENIHPKQELTYDYGYALNSVVDENDIVKTLTCHCGTSKCRGRLY